MDHSKTTIDTEYYIISSADLSHCDTEEDEILIPPKAPKLRGLKGNFEKLEFSAYSVFKLP